MSEMFPDDSELLAMVEDAQTGVPFIATGKAPYYLEFRKMLQRLLVNIGQLGCRVFATGPLCVQAKPGRYWLAGQCKSFPGTTADLPLADNATNRIYLAADNTVAVATNWPGQPTEHVKLAEIVTANGGFAVADIADLRGYSALTSLASTLAATPVEINGALDGISANVTASNLSSLTGGGATTLHSHVDGFDQLSAPVLNMLADSMFLGMANAHASQVGRAMRMFDVFSDAAGIDPANSSGYSYDSVNHLFQIAAGATMALLHFDTDGWVDEAGHAFTSHSAVCATSHKQFGNGSLSSGYLTCESADFIVGAEVDFTVDFWFHATDNSAEQGLMAAWDTFNDGDFLCVYLYQGTLYVGTASGGHQLSTTAPGTGGWHHLAIVRASGTVTAYLDGTSFGTTANTGAASEHTLTLGSYGNTALFTGYIDEFRLLVGTAVWTDAFTPPGEPYAFSISDMNLRSTASATSAVSKTDLLLNVALPEGAVLNTDVCGYVSVDGGATFSQVTLAQQSDNGDGSVRLFGSLTGLTAGESLCIKVAAAGSAGVTQVWDWAILAGA